MNFIDKIEIGFLNLWIFTVLSFIIPTIGRLIYGSKTKKTIEKPELLPKEKITYYCWIIIQLILYVYSIFIPIIFDSITFYIGLIIFLIGNTINLCGNYNFNTTEQDQMVKKGMYKISRNPEYFSFFLIYLSMGLLCKSIIVIVISILHLILYQFVTNYEERMCIKKWGNEYLIYKNNTAKNFWFILF